MVNPNGIGGTVTCTITAAGKTKSASYSLVFKAEDPNNPVKITGYSPVCSSGSRTFSLNYIPPRATYQWSVGSKLNKLSETSTSVVVVGAPNQRGTENITITYTTIAGVTVTRTISVWVGTPFAPVTTPTGYPIYTMGYNTRLTARITSAPGASIYDGRWWSTGSVSPLYSTTGSSCVFKTVEYGRGDIYVTTSNACGTSASWGIPVNVTTSGGGALFSISPNPVSTTLTIEQLTAEEATSRSVLTPVTAIESVSDELQSTDQIEFLEGTNTKEYTVEIWSEQNKKVKQLRGNKKRESFDLSKLSKGRYILKIVSPTAVYSEHIIVE